MNENDLGKGICKYLVFLLILNIVAFLLVGVLNAFFLPNLISTLTAKTNGKPGWLELGLVLFLLELMVYVVWSLVLTIGAKASAILILLTFLVPFFSEVLGVNFGLVFGWYKFSDALGFKIFDVPVFMALAWEPILVASFGIAYFLMIPLSVEKPKILQSRLAFYIMLGVIGGLITTSTDLILDPFSVEQKYWVWRDGGPFVRYLEGGVPISNFVGWFKVAFLCGIIGRVIKDFGRQQKHSMYLTVYGPVLVHLVLLVGLSGLSILFLSSPEVYMIGVFALGPIILLAFAKIVLHKRELELLFEKPVS